VQQLATVDKRRRDHGVRAHRVGVDNLALVPDVLELKGATHKRPAVHAFVKVSGRTAVVELDNQFGWVPPVADVLDGA
jgi:hypothetical protein